MAVNAREQILRLITEAHHDNALDSSITPEMLPALAEAFESPLKRYLAKHDSFPAPKIFQTMLNNFIQDGPLAAALLALDSPQAATVWAQLRANLLETARRNWSDLNSSYQEEIVDRALIRIQRYLPNFLFKARLSTWIFKILMNEYLRLEAKIKTEQEIERSLDEVNVKGISLGERLPSPASDPVEIVERRQAIEELSRRIAELGNELDVKILRLHLAGYTLEEIKQRLGDRAPSIATIKRRKDRLIERIKADPLIKEIARQLGLFADENDVQKGNNEKIGDPGGSK